MIDIKTSYLKNLKQLSDELTITNAHALPKISHITVSAGLGKIRNNKDMVGYVQLALASITGQKPIMTKAKKSISTFKVREGDLVGTKVTLRGQKMYDFLNRFVNITLPRIRDFRGINEGQFDGHGNLTLGFKDQTAFIEVGQDSLDRPFGIGVTISIKRSDKKKSIALLGAIGFPLHQTLNKRTKTD